MHAALSAGRRPQCQWLAVCQTAVVAQLGGAHTTLQCSGGQLRYRQAANTVVPLAGSFSA